MARIAAEDIFEMGSKRDKILRIATRYLHLIKPPSRRKINPMIKKLKDLLFHNQTARQTVAKNTFWLVVSNFGGRIIRAVLIIYAARVLGAAGWGVFAYAISVVAFITTFSDIGINSILLRDASRAGDENLRRKIISTSFITKMAALVLGVLAVIFIAPRATSVAEVTTILPIIVFILIFDTLRDFGSSVIRSLEKMEWEAVFYLLTNVAILAFGITFLHFSRTVQSLAYAYAIGDAVGVIATLTFLSGKLKGILTSFSFSSLKSILISAWPFAVSNLLGVLMINTDILIIGWILSAKDVGLYSAAQRIIQLMYLIPATINVSILPILSRLAAHKDSVKIRRIIENGISLVFAIGIPITVGGFILAKELMVFFFGPAYLASTLPFQVLILTILVDFPANLLSGLLFSYNRQRALIWNGVIGGGLNVVFDLLFIPRFGIAGSSLATLLAQLVSMQYLWWIARKANYFEVLSHLKRVILASGVMAIVALGLSLLSVHVLVNIAVSGVVYAGVLFFFREPLIKELKLILRPEGSVDPLAAEPTSL